MNAIFHALSDPTRRAMIERLGRASMPVTKLAEPFAMSAPAISKHVRVLERAGLLRREIRGRVHLCHLQADAMTDALSWMDEQRRFWEASLDNLETYFQTSNDKDKQHD